MSKVNHPSHYQSAKMEVIDVIRAFDLNFAVGNAIKYILRAGKKENSPTVEDYKKAIWYLCNEVEAISGEKVRVDVIEKEEPKPQTVIDAAHNSSLTGEQLYKKFKDYFYGKWVVSNSEHTGIKTGTVLEIIHVFTDGQGRVVFNGREVGPKNPISFAIQLDWIIDNYVVRSNGNS